MKKTIVFIGLFSITFFCVAQQESSPKKFNELKLNAFNLAVYQAIDLSYEYVPHENHSFGISLFFKINGVDGVDTYLRLEVQDHRNFSITPYYRRYFSKKYGKGIYLESFGMLSSGKYANYIFDNILNSNQIKNYTNFSAGLTAGVKWVTKSGFIIDSYFGLGAPILNNGEFDSGVTHGGISIGYRF